mgnify:CR=1 FL=1
MSGLEKIKVGVVGVGYMGEILVGSCNAHPLCDVVAICDVNEDTLLKVQKKHGVPRVYTDQAEMQDKEKLDAIVIATPDEHHRKPVELAAAAKLPIFLEKPLATTLQDGEAIMKAVKDAKIICQLGFVLRFIPHYVEIHEQVVTGTLGQVTNAFARRSCRLSEARRLYGRCSVNQYLFVHDMDFLLWCMGRDVENIYTVRGDFVLKPEIGVADYYWNVVRWKNGATAVLLANWNEPSAYSNYVEMQVFLHGTKASARALLAGQQYNCADEKEMVYREVSLYAAYPTEMAHFIDCVRLGKEPIVGVQAGMDTLRLLLAGEESANKGAPVKVDL